MNRETFGSVGLHLGVGARIGCHTYPAEAPILAFSGGGICLTVSTGHRNPVDATDVANARTLVEMAAVFLAECERLHAAQTGDQDTPKAVSADPVRGAAA